MRNTINTVAVLAIAGMSTAAYGNFATNGGFEAGDTSGWEYFPTAGSTFNVTNDSNSGSFAAELFNPSPASGAVIKQANVGIGNINPGDTIEISFAAKGSFAIGGVLFAELFSEIDGGGVSQSQILSGGPLFVADQTEWTQFSFTATAGPDVSGGITLQFAAVTGADPNSVAVAFIDDVVITPTPGSLAIFGLAGLAGMRRRR